MSNKNVLRSVFFSAVVLMFFGNNAWAGYGTCNYGNETVSSVTCYGTATLNGTKVQGKVFVAGELKATNATIGSLEVKGLTTLQGTTVQGTTNVIGNLESTNSNYTGATIVTGKVLAISSKFYVSTSFISDETKLQSSYVSGPVTMKDDNTTPYLYLTSETKIDGSITFQDRAGVVVLRDNSVINGQVINGQIIKP